MGVIYLIQCGKYRYIGSTKNLKRRLKNHKYHLRKGTHVNSILQRAYDKYGGKLKVIRRDVPLRLLLDVEDIYIGALSLISSDRKFGCNMKSAKDFPEKSDARLKMSKNSFFKGKTGYSHNRSREVHLYDLKGVYIKSVGSASEAARQLKVSVQSVVQCIKKIKLGKKASCKGYLISYSKDVNFKYDLHERATKQCKIVSMVSPKDMKIVESFPSIGSACRKYNLNDSNIIKSCKSNLKIKCNKYYWIYGNTL